MDFAQSLAERIQRTRFERFSAEAVRWAKNAICDTVAVGIAGVDSHTARITRRVTEAETERGACQIFGAPFRCGPIAAARANGAAAHALDYDDIHETMMGHPSVAILPAVLALAEARGSTGREALLAYLVGMETVGKLGRVLGFSHFAQGWHATETIGIYGAVAAASRLLPLTVEQTATALAIAVSFAAGLRSNFGTMMKPLHAGLAASNGILAAQLAQGGFTANRQAFDHVQGFFRLYRRDDAPPALEAMDDWADPPEILVPGIAIKLYPCGAHTHPFIEMIRRLAATHGLTAETVDRIDIRAEQSRHAHTNRPEPKSGLDAKFSVHYTVSRALLDGCVLLPHFEDAAVAAPAVRAVMAKIHAAPHPDMDASWADKYGGEMTVTTTDGRQFSDRIIHQLARGPENPVTDAELWTKFQDCTRTVLPSDRIEALFAELGRLEALESVSGIAALTVPDR
jgi:2-methylcitrate dehydratase PrpD